MYFYLFQVEHNGFPSSLSFQNGFGFFFIGMLFLAGGRRHHRLSTDEFHRQPLDEARHKKVEGFSPVQL